MCGGGTFYLLDNICGAELLNHPPPARSTGGIPKCASGVQLMQVRAVLGLKRST